MVVPWGCDFIGCDLKGCDFKGCDFKGCDFVFLNGLYMVFNGF